MKLILDNLNKFIRVWEGSSICQRYMNNSIQSYTTTITRLLQGMRYISKN